MECSTCIGSPLPSKGQGRVRVYQGQPTVVGLEPLTSVLSPLPKGRGEKGTKCAQRCFSFKEHPAAAGDMISVVFLYLEGLIRFPDLVEPFILLYRQN
jgi:hypothetical protein